MLDNQIFNQALGECGDFLQCEHSTTKYNINYLYPDRDNFTIPNESVILATVGRLGNQLFQYAAAYNLAKETNRTLYLFDQNCASCHLQNMSLDIEYYLTKFNLAEDIIIIPFSNETIKLKKYFYPKNFELLTNELAQHDVEYIKSNNYQQAIKQKSEKHFVIADRFIGNRYIDNFLNLEVTQQFTLNEFYTNNIDNILTKVKQDNSICIHFRGTDYLTTELYVPMDFQKTAIRLVESEKLMINPRYFVVTDDIPVAKSELKEYSNIEFVNETTTLEAFYILSHCRNNIITRSTFGWWSAFLNHNSDFTIMQCDYFDSYKKKPSYL